jgi:hypothetical protein
MPAERAASRNTRSLPLRSQMPCAAVVKVPASVSPSIFHLRGFAARKSAPRWQIGLLKLCFRRRVSMGDEAPTGARILSPR